jgi:hypothetical protein
MLFQHFLTIIQDDRIGTDGTNVNTQIEFLHPHTPLTSSRNTKILIDSFPNFQVKILFLAKP